MIKYLGSKRVLIPWILEIVDLIHQISPLSSIGDIFSGTGRVAHGLKAQGFYVVANDINAYAHILAQTLVAADARQYPEERLRPILEGLQALEGFEGFITKTYCKKARFFQPKNGEKVDAIRDAIDGKSEGDPLLRAILLTSLILAADKVDSTTGVQMAYLKKWAPRAHKDLQLRYPLLLPGRGEALEGDALEIAPSLDVDLTYLDPPYNQHAYLSNYHIWETLVRNDQPETYGVAQKRVDCRTRKSPFNSRVRAAGAMESLLGSLRSPHLILSFSNEGVLSAETLEKMLASSGYVTRFSRPHKRYVGAQIGIFNPKGKKVGKVSHTSNREHLFVCTTNKKVHQALRRHAKENPSPPERISL